MSQTTFDDAQFALRMLHFLQENTGAQHRHMIGAALADIVNGAVPRLAAHNGGRADEALHNEGCAVLGQVLTKTQAEDVVRDLERKPCYNGHVLSASDQVPRLVGAGAEAFHYGCYRPEDVLTAPYLIELANRPDILGVAERYLGCTPTLYGVNAWWSFSGHGQARYSQSFHRDLDDYRFCTLFCFLTDVGAQSGAHIFIRRSHRVDLLERIVAERNLPIRLVDLFTPANGYGKDDLYEAVLADLKLTITGPAGFGFMADTLGLHKGVPLTEGRRLMFWARYGLYKNPITADQAPPLPRAIIGERIGRDQRSAYINRCIVQ